jgi:hypothetical protein
MRLFGVGLGVAGWLCSGVLLLSPVMAQTPACTVIASAPSALIPSSFNSFGAMPQAVQSDSSSYFQVSCRGAVSRSGRLMLSILNSNAYNGTPQFRVLRADGIFTNTNNNYSSSSTFRLPVVPVRVGRCITKFW